MLKKFFNKIIYLLSYISRPFVILWRMFSRFLKKISRSWKWAKRMWNNPDWDFDYLIIMIVDKLKDMRYQFDVIDIPYVDLRHQPVNFNNNDEPVDKLKELDEAIEIGERIIDGNYIKYTPEIQKWFDENGHFGNKMPDNLNKKLLKLYKIADKQELNDRKKFFNLIRDNHQKWWS